MRTGFLRSSAAFLPILLAVATVGAAPVIRNGGLETIGPSGVPEDWGAMSKSEFSDKRGHSPTGTHSLKGVTDAVGGAFLGGGSTLIEGVDPRGETFENLSVWVFIPKKVGPITHIGFGLDRNANMSMDSDEWAFADVPVQRAKWTQVTIDDPTKLRVGPNTGTVSATLVVVATRKNVVAWFDDFEVNASVASSHVARPALAIPRDTAPSTLVKNVWQSDIDFGSTQGADSWRYMQWMGAGYSDMAYVPQGADGHWRGTEPQCRIDRDGMHPGPNSHVALTWIAPRAGTVRITGRATVKADTLGDGVRVLILKGGDLLYGPAVISAQNGFSQSVQASVEVAINDRILFLVDKNREAGADNLLWAPRIEYVSSGGVSSSSIANRSAPRSVGAAGVWNSTDDFADTQGVNNWHYRVWQGFKRGYDDMVWNAAKHHWEDAADPICIIGLRSTLHPGAHADPTRVWVAPGNGTISIEGEAKKVSVDGGDGTTCRLMLRDEELWRVRLDFDDAVGESFKIQRQVQAGDELAFRVNRLKDETHDTTTFFATIQYR